MFKKALHIYTESAGAVLLLTALLLLLGNLGSPALLQPCDPVFLVSLRDTGWAAGVVALTLALFCLFGRSLWLKLALLLWTGVNLLVLQAGFYAETNRWSLRGYFGVLEYAFQLPGEVSDGMLKMAAGGLILGSSLAMLWLWTTANHTLKMACPGCGRHIQFALKNLGQQVPCPQCRVFILLRRPGQLKMACYFCQGRIEFPSHALGQKMPCPHCQMDITLKEKTSA